MDSIQNKPDYGNWVSEKLIKKTLIVSAVFAVSAVLLLVLQPRWGALTIILEIATLLFAVLFLSASFYFLRARRLFSPEGGNIQSRILELVVSRITWDGKGTALDIGCGSGVLGIMIAKKYPESKVTGLDYWEGSWGYLKAQCERNAAVEGTAGRMEFVKGSASALPFKDETFDFVVSNLVFHEVKDTSDKRELVREALRVVKKGGCFVFQDLFQLKTYFGDTGGLVELIKSWGIEEVHYEDTSKSPFIPGALKLSFMTGAMGILYGIK